MGSTRLLQQCFTIITSSAQKQPAATKITLFDSPKAIFICQQIRGRVWQPPPDLFVEKLF
jgi:hypothetical protein